MPDETTTPLRPVQRWQLPLALVALLTAALTISSLRPTVRAIDYPSAIAKIDVLLAGGAFRDAADAAANLIAHKPTPPDEVLRELHNRLAEAAYRQEQRRETPLQANVDVIIHNHRRAAFLGHTPTSDEFVRLATALEWKREPVEAIDAWQALLTHDPPLDLRRRALRALIRLMDGRASFEAQRRQLIEEQLRDVDVSPAYLWAGVHTAMEDAIDREDFERAHEVLANQGGFFLRSDVRGAYDYLRAWLLISEGRHYEAAPLVDSVDWWFEQHGRSEPELADAGFRPALNRVLRGQISVAELRPQEALQFFDEAALLEGPGELLAAASAGRAAALDLLERPAAARQAIRDCLTAVMQSVGGRLSTVGQSRLSKTLYRLYDARRERGDHVEATHYLAMALELTPRDERALRLRWTMQLGDVAAHAAQSVSSPEEAAQLHELAGRKLAEAALMSAADPKQKADLLWESIQQLDLAGRADLTRDQLELFLKLRERDTRLPAARLQLAQALEAQGDQAGALKLYELVADEHSNLAEGARARMLRAQMLLHLADGREDEAIRDLERLLESDSLAPKAGIFREALLTLADHLYEVGRYASAIRRFEDFVTLYPTAEEGARVRFLLADAYRRSANELTRVEGQQADAAKEESARRFLEAARRFEQFLTEPAAATPDDPELALYRQLAWMYRADCLFALNTPESLEQALAAYRQAAARYQNEPEALVAHIRTALIHLRLGQGAEAGRAIEAARWQLRNMPDQAFSGDSQGSDRAGWDRYLATLAQSPLIADSRPLAGRLTEP